MEGNRRERGVWCGWMSRSNYARHARNLDINEGNATLGGEGSRERTRGRWLSARCVEERCLTPIQLDIRCAAGSGTPETTEADRSKMEWSICKVDETTYRSEICLTTSHTSLQHSNEKSLYM